ncbi:hypothetical protein AB8O64_37010 (plasmid) [Streptomyces sp. QH1-20]|uniref:hypothetical protein n=1 Tax=Streptomyces sp. QH1-20 TaxID=3240934 RepID=UPI003512AFAE
MSGAADEGLVQHPMVAVYPGARVPTAEVDTHALAGPDGTLQVHVTRYPVEPPGLMWQAPPSLHLHRMAIEPRPWDEIQARIPASWTEEQRRKLSLENLHQGQLAASAAVVVAHAGDTPALLALDSLRRRRAAALAVGVITGERTVLVWLSTSDLAAASGYTVTMTADAEPGPLSLYPSALLGWALWWREQADRLTDEHVSFEELPPPPLELDVVEAWTPYRVSLTAHERTTFTPLPSPPREPDGPEYR